MKLPLYKTSARQIAQAVETGELTAQKVVSYFIKRVDAYDEKIGALLLNLSDRAMEKAKEVDDKRARGEKLGKLAGVPIILKDNIHIKGEKTTCASKILKNYVAPFHSTVTRLIEEEDGIILGKSNLDEFAMGSSTEYSAYRATYNPWNLRCTAGGSSGGSAVAVAAGLSPIALGSDTGGSVRQPASFCGIYGYKPTYGRVSRFGLVAFGSSLDQIGPFARSADDVALIMEVMGKPCKEDSTSYPELPEPYLDELNTSIQGKTIGVPYSLFDGKIDDDVRKVFDESMAVYESLGCKIHPIELPMLKYSIPIYYIIATAEASTNLARYDGIRYTERSKKAQTLEQVYEMSRNEGFGAEVKQRILLGTYVLSAGYQDAYYRKAQKVRTLLIQEYNKAFKNCDVIAMPTSPTSAFELGAIHDPVTMYLQDIFTISANMAGVPGLNVPAGFDKHQKPIGIQIQGPQFSDGRVMRFAHHFEKATTFASTFPPAFDKEVN